MDCNSLLYFIWAECKWAVQPVTGPEQFRSVGHVGQKKKKTQPQFIIYDEYQSLNDLNDCCLDPCIVWFLYRDAFLKNKNQDVFSAIEKEDTACGLTQQCICVLVVAVVVIILCVHSCPDI